MLNTQLPQLAQAFRSGKITITQIVEAVCANYAVSEHQLNAYKTWVGTNALETAQHCLPIAMQLTAGTQQEVKFLALAQFIEQQLGYYPHLTN